MVDVVKEYDLGNFAAFNGEYGSKEASTDLSSTFGVTPDAVDKSHCKQGVLPGQQRALL